MSEAAGFEFVPDPAAWKSPGGITVRLPSNVRSKQMLIGILADRLQFPAWNRQNWDALEEALRDLSWLPPGSVTLVHEDLPFGAGGENRGIYLSILREVSRFWSSDPQRQFVAAFPAEAADAVASALAAAEEQH